jgi:hypothetical protein
VFLHMTSNSITVGTDKGTHCRCGRQKRLVLKFQLHSGSVHWEWQTHCVLMDGNVLPGVRRCPRSAADYLDVEVLGIQAGDSARHLPQEAVKSGCCGHCHSPFVVSLHNNKCSSSECLLMHDVCCVLRCECFAVQSASPSVRLSC